MKLVMALILAANLMATPALSELLNKVTSHSHTWISSPAKRLSRVMQEPLPGTIKGKDNPNAIPDHVAFEILLRAFGSRKDKDLITSDGQKILKGQVKSDRNVAMAESAELSMEELSGLAEVANNFTQKISARDRQEADIKKANFPDPTLEVMQQLRALQSQKEAMVEESMSALAGAIGEEGDKKIRKFAKEKIKKDVTFIPVPPPRQAHEHFHNKTGSTLKPLARPVAYSPTMQDMGGAYVYTNNYQSGDYAVGYCQATGDSYSNVHDYNATTGVTSPDYRYLETSSGFSTPYVETSTYLSIIDSNGIYIDGVYTTLSRVEVYCSIGLRSYIVSESGGEVNVPPPPVITSISPSRAMVGAGAIEVGISGSGFGTNPNVTAGTGITVTIDQNGSTPSFISATFNIATSATAGNHTVKVKVGPATATKNFFIQIPTSLNRESITGLMDLGGCGAKKELAYTLRDQAGQQIVTDAVVTETLSNFSVNPSVIQAPAAKTYTMEAGNFGDLVGYSIDTCPPAFTATLTQGFKVGTYTLNTTNSISMGRNADGTKFVNITKNN